MPVSLIISAWDPRKDFSLAFICCVGEYAFFKGQLQGLVGELQEVVYESRGPLEQMQFS